MTRPVLNKAAALGALCVLLQVQAFCSEDLPGSAEIEAALKQGEFVRARYKVLPELLQKQALLLTIGGVRCGHLLIDLENGDNDNGYKLSIQSSIVTGGSGRTLMAKRNATFTFGDDFGLRTALIFDSVNVTENGQNRQLAGSMTAVTAPEKEGRKALLQDDVLTWSRTDNDDFNRTASKRIELHGCRPIPREALIALPQLTRQLEQAAKPLCVPVMDLNWQIEKPAIQPYWISFAAPEKSESVKNASVLMKLRKLTAGEENGTAPQPPTPELWKAVETWTLDDKFQLLDLPEDPRIHLQPVDAQHLDVDAALDISKINDAFDKAAAEARK